MTAPPNFEMVSDGIFLVRYASIDDMAPARQAALVAALEVAQRRSPLALGFVLSPAIGMVPMNVPTFWLNITMTLKLYALGVASSSTGVRVATTGFGLAQQLRPKPIAVRWFINEEQLTDWLMQASRPASQGLHS